MNDQSNLREPLRVELTLSRETCDTLRDLADHVARRIQLVSETLEDNLDPIIKLALAAVLTLKPDVLGIGVDLVKEVLEIYERPSREV